MNRLQNLVAAALALLSTAAALAQPVAVRTITTQNLTPTATCTVGSCGVVDMTNKGGATVGITGAYTASGGLSLQRTVDGNTWETITSSSAFVPVSGTAVATIPSGTQATYQIGGACTGFIACRVTALGAVTGTATVVINTTPASVGGNTTVSGGAGDASASNQVTGNASLASIDSKTPALGQALASASVPVVLPSATVTALTPPVTIAVAQGSATSGQVGPLLQGAVTTSAPSYTTAQTSPLSLTTAGALRTAATVASGGVASGAFASGALASGSVASGAMVDLGAQADSAAAADTSTASLIALMKRNNQNLTTVNTSINTAANYEATKDAAVPTRLVAIGARSGANEDAVAQGSTTAAINISSATTTQLVALSGSTKIYVTGLVVIVGGTGNVTLVYGTGSNCGTGTTSLSGPIPLIANAGFTIGSGLGPVLIVPAGQALCATTSSGAQVSGFVTYTQF